LRHNENKAEAECYEGFHRWNLSGKNKGALSSYGGREKSMIYVSCFKIMQILLANKML